MDEQLTRELAELDGVLINKYENDTELFAALTERQRELGLLSDGRTFSPFLRHQYMPRGMYDEIVRASELLAAAFDMMTRAALEDPEMMSRLGLTEREERYARIDPGYPEVCNSSRLDSFISGENFSFLEYNGETPAGIVDQMQILKVLELVPEAAEFLAKHPHYLPRPHEKLLDALISGYRDYGGTEEKPQIAIVDWKGVATVTEFEVLKEYFESRGYPTVITQPDELSYDGEMLFADDFRVDIFYKRVLIHELFEAVDDDHPFLRAYRDGNVFMANSFRTKIPHKKASFAVLRTEEFHHLFTDEQVEVILKHLPWTRRVGDRKVPENGQMVDLLEHIRENREKLIMKPNDDYGGSGIIVGWESTESEWDDAIENALEGHFVVQERVDVERVKFPSYAEKAYLEDLLIDFDPFLFRGKVEGGLVRLSAQTLVNVSIGGGETALAVLEDT